MSKPSPYDNDAKFRCSHGCGTTKREDCHVHKGHLVCPHCRYIGSLRWDEEFQDPVLTA